MELLRIFGDQFIKDLSINFGIATLLCLAFFLAVVYTVVKVIMTQEPNRTTNVDESKKDNKK